MCKDDGISEHILTTSLEFMFPLLSISRANTPHGSEGPWVSCGIDLEASQKGQVQCAGRGIQNANAQI